MTSYLKPWLWIPASLSHTVAPFFLRLYGSQNQFQTLTWKPFSWRGIHFTNPLGLAAGVDKNATQVQDWWTLGPGFVEIGTVTPLPQKANPGLIMDRNLRQKALWNKMGFPNDGADVVSNRLTNLPQPHFAPVFVNIGKNRTTSNEKAHEDYSKLMLKFRDLADAFVINISSPNTEGLRGLQARDSLEKFLVEVVSPYKDLEREMYAQYRAQFKDESQSSDGIKSGDLIFSDSVSARAVSQSTTRPTDSEARAPGASPSLAAPASEDSRRTGRGLLPPVLLKLSPDLSESEFCDAIAASATFGIDGWVITNTTRHRDKQSRFSVEGGVSGAPVAELSKQALRWLNQELGRTGKKDRLVVSAGGVLSPSDVFERLEMGADLVEVYSALAFHGPFFFRDVAEAAELRGY